MDDSNNIAYIGIGSNIGHKKKFINKAVSFLRKNSKIKIIKISGVIQSKPQGYLAQPDFLNAVIAIKTTLSPSELLKFLNNIEEKLGRKRIFKDAPRTIDLDILLYNNITIKDPNLKVPHPKMFQRLFVIEPLKELLNIDKEIKIKNFNDIKSLI